jgi:hypothetical protein
VRAPHVLSPKSPHIFSLPSHLKIRLCRHPNHPYPPMGNCCGSAATGPFEPLPGPQVTELRPFAPARLQPTIKEESSVPSSSQPPSRRRTHSSASKHKSTHNSGRPSQDPIPRSRTKSAPQPPQTFNAPSPQDPRPSARSVVRLKSSHSDSRATGPGETIFGSGP